MSYSRAFAVCAVVVVTVLIAVPSVSMYSAAATPAKAVVSRSLVPASNGIPDTTSAINAAQPLSQRVVHYEMDARLDAKKKSLDATEVLTYRNLTGRPQDTFPFHLYLNAFQPKSTFVAEARRDRAIDNDFDAFAAIRTIDVGAFRGVHGGANPRPRHRTLSPPTSR